MTTITKRKLTYIIITLMLSLSLSLSLSLLTTAQACTDALPAVPFPVQEDEAGKQICYALSADGLREDLVLPPTDDIVERFGDIRALEKQASGL